MPDVIRRLPESLANRIAAGEVVQRPASVVKELLENAVDAGADHIWLAIRDGGATQIMVGDNGVGMSNTDARLCFERHATSKIKEADDLFRILTKGFRGEALASIAAVARVELKTRQHEDETGTRVVIEGGHLQVHELCQTSPGTVISVKNLFYNTPARRKFLKSESVETRLITEEFTRVALAHPEIHFEYISQDKSLYNLPRSSLLQRILALFGTEQEQRLIPVKEHTEILRVQGFVGKADCARKTKADQYVFVNNRYIRSGLVGYAVESAYAGLISPGYKPTYFLYLELDPAEIDVNIHPSKTELKFADDRSVFHIVRSAVRRALGVHHMASAFSFDEEPVVASVIPILAAGQTQPTAPPWDKPLPSTRQSGFVEKNARGYLEALYPELANLRKKLTTGPSQSPLPNPEELDSMPKPRLLVWRGEYVVATTSSGLILVHYRRAMERIFFEQFLYGAYDDNRLSQPLLFPLKVGLPRSVVKSFEAQQEWLNRAGFNAELLGPDHVVVYSHPPDIPENQVGPLVEEFLLQSEEEGGRTLEDYRLRQALRLAASMARHMQPCSGTEAAESLLARLFSCRQPEIAPGGQPCFRLWKEEDIVALLS
ncbi:MAG: DNA mismatch repair endonuclease MutL [Flavobacteriales bacterium]|nr:DNA mismatch repair endonuclease MutL [Flavobacteriales bacterium]MCX7767508.1 DNA mismatch repair endonuclease MutL [Flavobacteriales bacterium]MDW8409643.1 DNA mismatch repair endonuclease MutL [Flavobacteriales bacterium]